LRLPPPGTVPPGRSEFDKITKLPDYFNPHRSCGPAHALNGGIDRRCVEVGHLLPSDFFDLLNRHLADFVFVRRARSFGDSRRPLQQDRCRWRLGDESERAVVIDRHHDWDDESFQFLGAGARIELLAELHDVDLRLAERRTYRWRRRRFARRNLKLY